VDGENSRDRETHEEADAALFRSDELHNVVDPKPPDQPGKAVTPGKTLGPLPPLWTRLLPRWLRPRCLRPLQRLARGASAP
jgi:hypothetical protein